MTREDSEKRFDSIMDKLFYAPKLKPLTRSSGNQSSRGQKRGNSLMNVSVAESSNSGRNIIGGGGLKLSAVPVGLSSSEAPLCRPWDRGDLMGRLATFKSMTWFGKPKVVSAVNCARRGWINVEMDIIACEACGARLLFSTPSSWTQQQIEKAAAVFSLKLDSGHKLLCPWIDNACDESLAQFPPTPVPALVDGYKERSRALLRLSALPMISSSAIDFMRSPQLECFLKQSSTLEFGLADTYGAKYLGIEHEAVSANLYYQALKLISLCGWEPRSLPYVVDCEDQSTQSANTFPKESSSQIVNGWNPGAVMYLTSVPDEVMELDEDHPSFGGQQSDPASVVLDCRLCGASVGLWAFSTIPRPLELFRVAESSEANGGRNDSANSDANVISCIMGPLGTGDSEKENHVDHSGCIIGNVTSSKEGSLSLNLSIAGGPTPEKQNFRATVSLPVITRHLLAGFSTSSNVQEHIMSKMSCINKGISQCDPQSTNSFQQENVHIHTDRSLCKQIVQPEDMETLNLKSNEDGLCIFRGDDHSCFHCEFNEEDALRNEKAEGMHSSELEVPSTHALGTCSDSLVEDPTQKMPLLSGANDPPPEDAENVANTEKGVDASSHSNNSTFDSEMGKNSLLTMVTHEVCNHQLDEDFSRTNGEHHRVTSEASHHESSYVLSSLEVNEAVDMAHKLELQKGDQGSDFQLTKQEIGVKETVQPPANNEGDASHGLGNDLKRAQLGQAMEFDPIRQHRHFCPWIVSIARAAPGWLQTLSALDHAKESSHDGLTDAPSSSMFEVDDPIASIRKLFMSPPTKKMKASHRSS